MHVDSSGIEALGELARGLRAEQVTLVVARLRSRMLADFETAGVLDQIGRERFYPSVELAVAACTAASG